MDRLKPTLKSGKNWTVASLAILLIIGFIYMYVSKQVVGSNDIENVPVPEKAAKPVNLASNADYRVVLAKDCHLSSFELINLTGLNMQIQIAQTSDKFVALDKKSNTLTTEINQKVSYSEQGALYSCNRDNSTFKSHYVFHERIKS